MTKKTKKSVESPFDKQYPNTRLGVRAFLREASTLNLRKAKSILEDMVYEGVWMVTFPNEVVIVYLKGCKDQWGVVRQTNDFEQGDLR